MKPARCKFRQAAARPRLHALALCCALAGLQAQAAGAEQNSELRRHQGLLTLEYQRINVPGDEALDLAGFHSYQQVYEGLYLGAGFYAPVLKGQYGGFVAADLGAHVRWPLGGPWKLIGGLSAGGGGGGRDVEHSKLLSGSGGFAKAYAGLSYDLGDFSLGVTLSHLKFAKSIINGTQLNLMLEVPYDYLTGPFARHGEALPPREDAQAAASMGESMLTLALDNYRQLDPKGSNKSTIRLADLQYAHFFSRDSYWFAGLGMGYHGLPLYNQVQGGIGQRWQLSPEWALYGQLGLGSGGYAPDVIDTASGLMLYPKLSAEYALSRDLGLAFSLGYMAAPKGSSRNQTYGLSLVKHLRSGGEGAGQSPARYQGLRLSVFQQSATQLRYRDIERPTLQMISLQLDVPLSERFYLPLQASGAYNAYLGYPGYAEILGGLGVQTLARGDERWQGFAQLLAGANVHGKTAKASLGLRYIIDERFSLNASIGHTEARGRTGGQFKANNLGLGFDYRFAIPTR